RRLMAVEDRVRGVRGALRNALVWGAGFSALGFGTFSVLRIAGVLSGSWVYGLGLAARMGIIGFVAGGAFSSVIRLVYRGRRLRDINWVRFGIAGGIVTGVFVPLFLQTMNLVTGGGLVAWSLVLDDGIWGAVFGAIAAGGSLKLAQRADAIAHKNREQL